jgi:hypothetical protein
MWFFVLADCDGLTNNNTFKAHLELKNGQSYLSEEEEGLIKLLGISFILILILLYSNLFSFLSQMEFFNRIDHPLVLVILSLAQLVVKTALTLVDLIIKDNYGASFILLKIIPATFSLVSQFIMSMVFVLLAKGWTTNFQHSQNTSFELLEKFLCPICVMIGLHWIIAFLMIFDDEGSHKFHQY